MPDRPDACCGLTLCAARSVLTADFLGAVELSKDLGAMARRPAEVAAAIGAAGGLSAPRRGRARAREGASASARSALLLLLL